MGTHLLVDLIRYAIEGDQRELLSPEKGGALTVAEERCLVLDW
ncbi:hypothetical protein KSC_091410 [Ktedonobacter sp. SOSP1-52]|nr:hypothetical protein KSC_091410 [Ktedonobacter sp. SOSP1-52]